MKTEREHVLYIDILKAIACISVLAGHVISGIVKANMSVSEVLHYLHTYVYLFHVPCFFFASGYLYASNPVREWKEYGSFILKKMLALGLPYVVCTAFYIGLSSFLSNEMNSNTSYSFNALCSIWREPIMHYWYLYALFVLFAVIPVIELIFRNVNKELLWCGFALLTCIRGGAELPCIKYILQYSYLFYMGVVWNGLDNRNKRWFLHDKLIRGEIYCIESIVLFFIYILVIDANILSAGMIGLWKNIITTLLVITMVRMAYVIAEKESWIKRFLLWVAGYSLYIYLFHNWFSGTIRIVLRRMGIINCWVQVFIGFVVGLLGPVLLTQVIRKMAILQFWIEPLVVIKRRGSKD